ncbi:histidine kinase [Actinomyces sp. oral taxon 171]|uniref:histidine kinase n=1 Tax=Actinomyces sp. oral taxon 171 TaxID=706438 RepID=UPI0001F61A8A|nr:histidine kinase [Actinomyces sp. oral taxon 171 str. F0337]QCT34525.1 histidine kinase [Actinomyces sp. oral taxon 171 str. F0337]
MGSETDSGTSWLRMCLTRSVPSRVPDSAVRVQSPPRLPRAAVALCLLSVLPYVGMVIAEPEYVARQGAETVSRAVVLSALATLQIAAVMMTARFPYWVLGIVASADLIILIASDRSGLGSVAVMVVIWYLVRYRVPGWQIALFANVIAFILVFLMGEVHSGHRGMIAMIILLSVHLLQRYLLPVAVAEYMLGRERLHQALRDKAELLEREKQLFEREERERVERELRTSRNALARDLHDIAGHHLSGVIVSAQAAVALRHKDPERSDQMLQTVQDSARTALADLRQVVGLLRSEDSNVSGREDQGEDGRRNEPTLSSTESAAVTGSQMTREPVLLPSLEAVPHLVEESRRRQQRVGYAVNGRPCPLSPLADTAAYRMVQESLANCARHAPGAPCQVRITYQQGCVEIVVSNRRPPNAEARQAGAGSKGGGYGLSGMAERAALVGAELVTGPDPDGGWRNRLVIPVPPGSVDGSRTEEEVDIP